MRTYEVPSFDPEPRELSESERTEIIALSENMLTSGILNISGEYGSTVSYTTSFEFTYSDESVNLAIKAQSDRVTLKKLDNGQYIITCNLENLTEPVKINLFCEIKVDYMSVSYVENIVLTLTPTNVPEA